MVSGSRLDNPQGKPPVHLGTRDGATLRHSDRVSSDDLNPETVLGDPGQSCSTVGTKAPVAEVTRTHGAPVAAGEGEGPGGSAMVAQVVRGSDARVG